MIKRVWVISFLFFVNAIAAQSKNTYDVLQYGIVGDSNTVNTAAIQKLIDECSVNGGGTVRFPKGRYVSGTILIKDNVTLLLEKDATLLGSTNINDYQLVDPFKTGNGAPMGYCFVGAVNAKNVGITGKGLIDGRGTPLLAAAGKGKRPFLVRFVRSAGIKLNDVTLTNSAAWTCHFFACKSVDIKGVYIDSKGLGNNDGFDIDCSQNVSITNCDIISGDDGLCFKTTWSKMACKDIVVNNLRIKSNHGGIKWGTESMAPFENIKITNIYIYDTHNGGIKMNTVDGAQIRNVEISNVVMDNVRTPMLFRLGSRRNVFRKEEDTQQPTGTIENVTIRNVKAKAAAEAQIKPPSGILITGVPGHYITNLTLENIDIELAGGGTLQHARHEVPEAIDKYPEVSTFGPTIPAYGIWARHVQGLKLNNINIKLDSIDLRPALIVQDGINIAVNNLRVPKNDGAESVIRFEDVKGAAVKDISVKGRSELVKIEGSSSDIKILK
jgi:polygalacturonase